MDSTQPPEPVPATPATRRCTLYAAIGGEATLALSLATFLTQPRDKHYALPCLLLAIGALLLAAAFVLPEFGPVLLLFNGPLWHWELNEKPPVVAAAALAQTADPTLPLALWGHGERPSLSWQSQRQLIPLARLGIPAGSLQLLSPVEAPIPEVANHHCDQQTSSEDGWSLWICAPRP